MKTVGKPRKYYENSSMSFLVMFLLFGRNKAIFRAANIKFGRVGGRASTKISQKF